MNRRTAFALLILTVLLAGLALWWRATSAALSAADTEKNAAVRKTETNVSAATPQPLGLPADRQDETDDSAATDPRVAKLFQHFRGGPRRGRLSRQAIEAYLEDRGRGGLSLLAAWQESGSDAYLREAAERFPDDPNVQIAAAMSPAFAAKHAEWRERLKQADPSNPLPHWLAAAEHFSAKQNGPAIAELLAANGKNGFNAYNAGLVAERQAMFEAAGFDPLRARIEARFDQRLEYIQRLQSATRGIEAEVTALRGRGDLQTAQDLSVTALNLGRMLTGNEQASFIEQLVGRSVESAALKQIPASEAMSLLGANTAQRAADLEKQQKEFSDLMRNANITDGRSSMAEVVEFFRRAENDGEVAALRWLASQRSRR